MDCSLNGSDQREAVFRVVGKDRNNISWRVLVFHMSGYATYQDLRDAIRSSTVSHDACARLADLSFIFPPGMFCLILFLPDGNSAESYKSEETIWRDQCSFHR